MARSERGAGGPARPSGPNGPPPAARRPPAAPPRGPAGDGTGFRLRRTPDSVLLWGFHAVLEALHSPRRVVLRLLCTAPAAARVAEAAAARGLVPVVLAPADLDAALPRDAVHQGLALEARAIEGADLTDLPDSGTVIVLDQVTDPHNTGAILRTAAAFGVAALVTTERHAPEMTGVLAKAASGGLEHVPVVRVGNLARALDTMARAGYQLIGLDSAGTTDLAAVAPAPAVALVLGAEGHGLRRLTQERCEIVARLDMPGAIKSLNVSNACAVALTILRLRGG